MKKLFVFVGVLVIVSFFMFFAIAIPTHAAVLPSFGGLDVMMFPCTCTFGAIWWHFFTPLYINSPIPLAGPLASTANIIAYPSYYLHPGSWVIGTYTPGAGAACWVGVEPYCVPLPNLGLISPMTASSPI
jgi:hypothetical protein